MIGRVSLATCLLLAGCERQSSLAEASASLPPESGSAAHSEASAAPSEGSPSTTHPATAPAPGTAVNPAPAPAPAPTPTTAPSSTSSAPSQDDPKISRSAGVAGGVVILWPRVIPSDITDMNRRLVQDVQSHLRVLVQRALPGRQLDVRPEPERVCRRSGCEGTSVTVMFTRHGDGCAAVAVVTPPGPVEMTLVPWAGGVEISRTTIPYRDPPESYIRVKDLARCSELLNVMRQNDAAVEAAIRKATPAKPTGI